MIKAGSSAFGPSSIFPKSSMMQNRVEERREGNGNRKEVFVCGQSSIILGVLAKGTEIHFGKNYNLQR
jgi:hypothetical protein